MISCIDLFTYYHYKISSAEQHYLFQRCGQSLWRGPGPEWILICWREGEKERGKEEVMERRKKGRERGREKEEKEGGEKEEGNQLSGPCIIHREINSHSSKAVGHTPAQAHPVHPTQKSSFRALWLCHLHSEVGDESCGWNLHQKLNFLVLRSSIQHSAGNRSEGIARNNGRLHREFCHQRFGFLLELKHTVFSMMCETMIQPFGKEVILFFSIREIIFNLEEFGMWFFTSVFVFPDFTTFYSLHV